MKQQQFEESILKTSGLVWRSQFVYSCSFVCMCAWIFHWSPRHKNVEHKNVLNLISLRGFSGYSSMTSMLKVEGFLREIKENSEKTNKVLIFFFHVIDGRFHDHSHHQHQWTSQRKIVKKNNNNTERRRSNFHVYKTSEHEWNFWYCCSNRCRVNTLIFCVSGQRKETIGFQPFPRVLVLIGGLKKRIKIKNELISSCKRIFF